MARSIRKPGVYKITNTINSKFYIGSSSLNVYYRWSDHLSQMRTQIHPNIHLQRSFNKHGENSFEFIVLELCAAEECITREQYYIDELKPHYNICTKAGSSLGQKRRPETCAKIGLSKLGNKNRVGKARSEEDKANLSFKLKAYYSDKPGPMTGKSHSEETRAKMKANRPKTSAPRLNAKIDQFDMDGNYIQTFDTVREAAESIDKNRIKAVRAKIGKSYNSSNYSAYGFRWKLNVLIKSDELLEA